MKQLRYRNRKTENQNLGPGLAYNLDFAKGKGLKPKIKKISQSAKLGDVVSKLV